jgi:Protein of unknown function (DUF3251)
MTSQLLVSLLIAVGVSLPIKAAGQAQSQAELRAQVEALRGEIASLKDELGQARVEIWKIMPTRSVKLDPAAPGKYERLDTDVGHFLISLENVVPYVDGYKVLLKIGNPLSADYGGFEVKATWGKRFVRGLKWADWRRSLQVKTVTSTDRLRSGVWNKFEIVLAPAQADSLGYLEVGLTVDQVILRTAP